MTENTKKFSRLKYQSLKNPTPSLSIKELLQLNLRIIAGRLEENIPYLT